MIPNHKTNNAKSSWWPITNANNHPNVFFLVLNKNNLNNLISTFLIWAKKKKRWGGLQRTAPPQSHPLPDLHDKVWSGERRHNSDRRGERWCRCSRACGAQEPAGTQGGPEIVPCCCGWSLSVCLTAETPSPPTGSSCGDWGLGWCWSSWNDDSLAHCPSGTVRTAANTEFPSSGSIV